MKKRRMLLSVALMGLLLGMAGIAQAAGPVNFYATDEPGPWFKCVGNGCVPAGTQSLAIVPPNTTVQITNGGQTNTVHTFTSLLWPVKADGSNADNMPFDQPAAFRGSRSVNLQTPGLYVFVCKLHPFMLAATVVDDPATTTITGGPAYDLGERIRLISYPSLAFNTSSDLATRLLRTFFLITNPANYQDHNPSTNVATSDKPAMTWRINYPAGVNVKITGGAVVDLKGVLEARYGNNIPLTVSTPPSGVGNEGVGEIWVDAEYEKTSGKTKPGTALAVDASTWKVTKRVALPQINMNNPHNMWTDKDQTVIYQTQWFDHKLTVFNRVTGALVRNIHVGDAPAHVMTRVDTDQVHVSLNGEDAVIELNPGTMQHSRRIFTQHPGELPAQPHAHTMSFDGHTMVTPNSNTADSTRIDLVSGTIADKLHTGTLPIATGMMPDASKYYVSNYLDSTITCISIGVAACKTDDGLGTLQTKEIALLLGDPPIANYDPGTGAGFTTSGGLPIQTPVSPDGKFVVTANTLTGTITFIDTKTDTLVKVLTCSAGCHGVNFGARKNPGSTDYGYYAYVSSKFSNDLIVINPNPNNDDSASDAVEVGRVLLVGDSSTSSDDTVTALAGMGGQGVLPIPLVYNGWVQNLPSSWCNQLTSAQRSPIGTTSCTP